MTTFCPQDSGTPSHRVHGVLGVGDIKAVLTLEVEIARAREHEALAARDAAIERLNEACTSIRQKAALLERLQNAKPDTANEQVIMLEATVKTLRKEIDALRCASHSQTGFPPKLTRSASAAPQLSVPSRDPLSRPATASLNSKHSSASFEQNSLIVYTARETHDAEPEDIEKARNAMLATLPLPLQPPDEMLKPIILPPASTLHEFLANASGPLRNVLSNYRILQELTTSWCPEREEHGYMLAPLFKCSTNPRVPTAHRWSLVDIMAYLSKPTECFYSKDGKLYYAGVYQGFRLADLTVKEWEALSTETTQALVKETIAGRKNTSPQNFYETAQLYAAGALKVACVGLQCVGFNKVVYHEVLEQAARYSAVASVRKAGLGVAGSAWNAAAGDVADGMACLRLEPDGNENTVPGATVKGK
ncbi:hypothetical protein MKEN_01081900 [Mycena kentingensis (nom. inval.)]|nr:hypothetical protein MKEN_01081900 [Mycena kentingensis (nom. inval.)]